MEADGVCVAAGGDVGTAVAGGVWLKLAEATLFRSWLWATTQIWAMAAQRGPAGRIKCATKLPEASARTVVNVSLLAGWELGGARPRVTLSPGCQSRPYTRRAVPDAAGRELTVMAGTLADPSLHEANRHRTATTATAR